MSALPVYDPATAPRSIVFDIETASAWGELPAAARAAIMEAHARAEARLPAELRGRAENDPEQRAGLSPWTGKVISVAMYEVDRGRGLVLYEGDRSTPPLIEDGFRIEAAGAEQHILARWWRILEGAADARIVGFNSRGFDAAFLHTRSFVHGVPISRNAVPYKYSCREHLDLFETLAFWQRARVPSLEVICGVCGIESPKRDLAGDEVDAAYRRGEILRIARYNAADVRATAEVFQRWEATVGAHFGERSKR